VNFTNRPKQVTMKSAL